jgi:hypothetical protein
MKNSIPLSVLAIIIIGYLMYLAMGSHFAKKNLDFSENQTNCVSEHSKWQQGNYQQSAARAKQVDYEFYAKALVTMNQACSSGPFVEGRDYSVPTEISDLAKTPRIIEAANLELKKHIE